MESAQISISGVDFNLACTCLPCHSELMDIIMSSIVFCSLLTESTKMTQPLTMVDVIKECHEIFRDASNNPYPFHREWAENRLADFNLWLVGANATGSGKSSLQARLATRLEAHTFLIHLVKLLMAFLRRYIELGT